MPFDPYAPVSETNRLPIVAVVTGSFDPAAPVATTNPLPAVATDTP